VRPISNERRGAQWPGAHSVSRKQLLKGDMTTNTWTPICRVDDIPVLGARRVARERGIAVAVFRNAEDQVFALLDRCPHKGGPLSQGIVFGQSVACPLHNWTIGLADGCAKAPDEGCTTRFACKAEAGQVYLDAHELATLALDVLAPVAGPRARIAA
jgi:nitrite reductase (NADH) small subunit